MGVDSIGGSNMPDPFPSRSTKGPEKNQPGNDGVPDVEFKDMVDEAGETKGPTQPKEDTPEETAEKAVRGGAHDPESVLSLIRQGEIKQAMLAVVGRRKYKEVEAISSAGQSDLPPGFERILISQHMMELLTGEKKDDPSAEEIVELLQEMDGKPMTVQNSAGEPLFSVVGTLIKATRWEFKFDFEVFAIDKPEHLSVEGAGNEQFTIAQGPENAFLWLRKIAAMVSSSQVAEDFLATVKDKTAGGIVPEAAFEMELNARD